MRYVILVWVGLVVLCMFLVSAFLFNFNCKLLGVVSLFLALIGTLCFATILVGEDKEVVLVKRTRGA